MKQAMTWLSRRLGWDRNPLRSRADRVEAAIFAGLLAGLVTDSALGSSDAWAPVRWPVPGHRTRQGLVEVGAAAGRRARVWTDGAGRLTSPPLTRQAIQLDVTLTVLIAPVAGFGATDSGRLGPADPEPPPARGWDRAWATVGPRWTPQP